MILNFRINCSKVHQSSLTPYLVKQKKKQWIQALGELLGEQELHI